MTLAYLDCVGGISGDMALAALLDAGADLDRLLEGLRTMPLPPWELEVREVARCGIRALHVEVTVAGQRAGAAPLLRPPPADAPLAGPSGHTHEHGGHSHSHEHGGHTHSHDAEAPAPGPTTTFAGVESVIRSSGLPEAVRRQAVEVFRRLGEAEARVHGTTLDRVHFHEVGAVDSIVDVVGAVYGLHLLGVDEVRCSPLAPGRGSVQCDHGRMPVPTPATLELLRGCPLRESPADGELVTPTGAALASTLAASWGDLAGLVPERIGCGAGTKELPVPNLLRVVIGSAPDPVAEARRTVMLQANVDDQSPQLWEPVTAALFRAGALDVWLTPIVMKKGRPAVTLSVLAAPGDVDALEGILLRETTTLGVRRSTWDRTCLHREWRSVETPFGPVRVKIGRAGTALRSATPEFEDCRALAESAGAPVKVVEAAAAAAAWEQLAPEWLAAYPAGGEGGTE